ncbi:HD domain-containing phosphohydrolase [Shewanella aestuarii]|uniref:HD domain-containing protein n=1 Tax=Shewanella aestuarii TaxID=1028752 RepID=A0A6G9QK59_9GAMM|nr:HD domain-containing phosphohydrolase [Shewanella aestuarii]QIR14954.1 HD domain-containing protein [Shewanella aestuarii]
MNRHQANFFLKSNELPKELELCWGVVNDRLDLIKLSEPLYKLINKPIASILKQPLSRSFSSLDVAKIDLKNRHAPQYLNFIDDYGQGYKVTICPIVDSDQHWAILMSPINLDDKWLMELHPDYQYALQTSDEWLQQIEAVLSAKPSKAIQTSVQQATMLTQSNVGYVHIFDQKNEKILMTAWSDNAHEHIAIKHNQTYSAHEGIWVEVIKTGKAFIQNEPIVEIDGKTALQGYFPFKRHLCVPIFYRGKLVGLLGVANRDKPYTLIDAKSLTIYATILWHSIELPRTLRAMNKQSHIIKSQQEKMTHILVQLVGAIAEALELKDAYTAGHQKSVAQLSCLIGERMGLDEDRLEGLKLGALIHDIGKLAIPSQILSKPSRLTETEFALVKQHSVQGALIVDEVEFPWPIKQMIRQHHERLDGSGYPDGLTADEIILEAKIIAVADVADSVLSHRPYRAALGMDALTSILLAGRDIEFDAEVVDCCLDILSTDEIKTEESIATLALQPVVFLEEYYTLEHAESLLKKAKMDVAIVLSEKSRLPIGVIDKHIMAFWHSPFLDTAAERLVDRNLLNKRVHQVMEHKFQCVAEDSTLYDAKVLMDKTEQGYLVVQNANNQVRGIVTWQILANALAEELEQERMHHS